jgi:hypothetical protein
MLKPLLIAMLIDVVSVIAFTIYFYFHLVGMKGGGAITHRVLLLFLYGASRWALIPAAPYLVYEFIVNIKRN